MTQKEALLAFESEKKNNIKAMASDAEMLALTRQWFHQSAKHKYSYNFSWMGIPVIQYPQDLLAMQEIIWRIKPDLIIETGIAYGGSLIFYASLQELIGKNGTVLGIDIDIRAHNREAIEKHPMSKRITMLEGSSLSQEIVEQTRQATREKECVLVVLDSNHSHEHVAAELELYSPLVSKGSYLVVFDTVIEDMSEDFFSDRPWGKSNNPKTAVKEFLAKNDRFSVDSEMDERLLISACPEGFLKCVK